MSNKVTIIIPTFNRADLVCKTIDGALSQTVPCNVIICDHGSSDNTPDVIKQYGDKIKYIRRERDFGPHFCWLEGVLNADTEFVHIHYDDDLIEPTFVEKTLSLMSEDVGMVVTDAILFNAVTNEIMNPNLFKFKERFKTGIYETSLLETLLMKENLMFSPAICLYRKKDIIDAILPGDLPINFGGNYHGVGPDLLMSLLVVLRYKKFGVVTESLTRFGYHDGSITIDASNNIEKQQKLANGYNAYRKYYKLLKLYKENNNIINHEIKQDEKPLKWNKKVERWFKLFFKAIGLRKKEVK